MYEVETNEFSGPISKLLEIIENKKMDITTVSLAKITANFIGYIENLEKNIYKEEKSEDINIAKLSVLSDFLIVATKLILIKSKSLLPSLDFSDEEKEEIMDLENKIRLYQSIKPIFKDFDTLWENNNILFTRKYKLDDMIAFNPPRNLDKNMIWNAICGTLKMFTSYAIEEKSIIKNKISLKEVIDKMLKIIEKKVLRFSELVKNGTKDEVIASFLALLHLLRDNLLVVKQSDIFGDIEINRKSEL